MTPRFQTMGATGVQVDSADGDTGRRCHICGKRELYAKQLRTCKAKDCIQAICHMCALQFDDVCSEQCRADLIRQSRSAQRSLLDIPV